MSGKSKIYSIKVKDERFVTVMPPYDGSRHYAKWVEHQPHPNIMYYTYEDGKLIKIEITLPNHALSIEVED